MCFTPPNHRKYLTYIPSLEKQEDLIKKGYDLILLRKVEIGVVSFPVFTMVKLISKIDDLHLLCITTSGVKILVSKWCVAQHSWIPKDGFRKVDQCGYIKFLEDKVV